MSCSVGPVIIADRLAKLPLDMVLLNPLSKVEYELMIDSLPVRFDKSSSTLLYTFISSPN